MSNKNTKESMGVIKSVLTANFILLMHIAIIGVLAFLVFFLRGVIVYMPFIFLAGTAAVAGSGYLFYRRLKKEGRSLKQTMASGPFNGRVLEVSFLGGLASFKLDNRADRSAMLETGAMPNQKQLEDPETVRIRELSELVRMLENDLITLEEFNLFKGRIMK